MRRFRLSLILHIGLNAPTLSVAFSPCLIQTCPLHVPTTRGNVHTLHAVEEPFLDVEYHDSNSENTGDDEEEEGESGESEHDSYKQAAASEFSIDDSTDLAAKDLEQSTPHSDWDGALGTLKNRVEDMETGKSRDPVQVLFRLVSSQTPIQSIAQFVQTANPETVQTMNGAVNGLLGSLSNPSMGMETMIKSTGERIGSLCFQLLMTGYMFRNAEYVLAIRDLMGLDNKASLLEHKMAFDRLDADQSGFIEPSEIQALFEKAYEGKKVPQFEVAAFLHFFDQDKDGKISWSDFEAGFVTSSESQEGKAALLARLLGESGTNDPKDLDEGLHADISGTIQLELENGKVINIEANDYVEELKAEARALKKALRDERGSNRDGVGPISPGMSQDDPPGIGEYLASKQGDVKELTEGISPEIIDTMRRLVKFVLDRREVEGVLSDKERSQMEVEIPGSGLHQLALWQLVLGYRLREAEATGDYLQLLQ